MPRPERPLDPDMGVLARLAADLRALRTCAGNPPYRVLGRRAHFAAATLSEAASGKKLPSLPVTLAYVRACGGDEQEWTTRWHAVAAELAEADPATPDDATRCPYVGMAAFQPEDADLFFGREQLVEELLDRVAGRHLLAVFGPSGSGKSSVLRAGLIPRLRQRDGDRGGWATILCTPGENPLATCATHLARLLGVPAGSVLADLRADPRHLDLCVRQALLDQPDTVGLVLVVDQFEEIFTACRDSTERGQFIAALVAAVTAEDTRTRVVLGVRADFYGRCAEHPDLVDVLRDSQLLVGPMQPEQLRAAITAPASVAGLAVEATLVSTMVTEVVGRSGALPLMAHALVETWRRRHGTMLTLASYRAAGGVEGAVAQTAERTYAGLSGEQQTATRDILLRLTALGEGTEDTRRRVPAGELDPHNEAFREAIAALVRARLVTVDGDSVEIAHEALIRSWPRLRTWLTEDRDGLHVHRQLTDATKVWERLGRDPGALYRGRRLAIARAWHPGRRTTLTTTEQDFLTASITAHVAEQRTQLRRARRLRALAGVLAVLVCLATVTTVVAVEQRQRAANQQAIVWSQALAARSEAIRAAQRTTAAMLAMAAYRQAPTAQAVGAVLTSQAPKLAALFANPDSTTVRAVAISAGGRAVALGNADRTTTVCSGPTALWTMRSVRPADFATVPNAECTATSWAQQGNRPETLPAGTAGVQAVWLAPDGHTLIIGMRNGTSAIWNLLTQHDVTITGKPPAGAVALSPDGHTLAIGSHDGATELCSPTPEPASHRSPCWGNLFDNNGQGYAVSAVAFSPDGRTMATADLGGTTWLWNVTNRKIIATFTGSVRGITALAFSPDGHTLAAANHNGAINLWNMADDSQIATLDAAAAGRQTTVRALAFGPDSHSLLTANGAGGIYWWDLDVDRVAANLCATIRPLTKYRWTHLVPNIPFQTPCANP